MVKRFAIIFLAMLLCVTAEVFLSRSWWRHKTFVEELENITEELARMKRGEDLPATDQFPKYSAKEYGPLAPALNDFREIMELPKQQWKVVQHAQKEVEAIFTDDLLFNYRKVIDAKQKLETYSVFLNTNRERIDRWSAELREWASSSPNLDPSSREFVLECHCRVSPAIELLSRQMHEGSQKFIQEWIKALDFVCGIYESYDRREDAFTLFSNGVGSSAEEAAILNAHFDTIDNLIKENNALERQWAEVLAKKD